MSPQNSRTDAELIDRMERDVDSESADETAARVPYQRLIERIGDLDVVEPPPGWVERAVDRWERSTAPPPTRPRRRWAPWGGLLAAAITAAVLIVLVPRCRDDGDPDRFEVAVTRIGSSRTGGAAVGDTLSIHAPRRAGDAVELRVYRDRVLIARCPGDARCRSTAGALELVLALDVPGTYQAIALTGRAPLPEPGSTGLELDVLEARKAGARIERRPPIDVR